MRLRFLLALHLPSFLDALDLALDDAVYPGDRLTLSVQKLVSAGDIRTLRFRVEEREVDGQEFALRHVLEVVEFGDLVYFFIYMQTLPLQQHAPEVILGQHGDDNFGGHDVARCVAQRVVDQGVLAEALACRKLVDMMHVLDRDYDLVFGLLEFVGAESFLIDPVAFSS